MNVLTHISSHINHHPIALKSGGESPLIPALVSGSLSTTSLPVFCLLPSGTSRLTCLGLCCLWTLDGFLFPSSAPLVFCSILTVLLLTGEKKGSDTRIHINGDNVTFPNCSIFTLAITCHEQHLHRASRAGPRPPGHTEVCRDTAGHRLVNATQPGGLGK